MAIHKQPREDLMREAAAYSRRLMLHHASCPEIFIGARKQGGWSIYFGEDPVYQFNAEHKLRRVHFNGQNYVAEQGKLLRLNRQPRDRQSVDSQKPSEKPSQKHIAANSGGRIGLDRIHDLSDEQLVLQDCHNRIALLSQWFGESALTVAEQFPEDCKLLDEVLGWLARLANGIVVADSGAV